MHDKQHGCHHHCIANTHGLGFETRQARPFPGTQAHDQADEQRETGTFEQEKPAQGDRQQDQRSDDSLFKH